MRGGAEPRRTHNLSAFVYILLCADGSYYVGSARGDLDRRIGEHQGGEIPGYTSTRRPVQLVFAEEFQSITDAIAAERRIKGWSRAKKEALIRGDWSLVQWLAKRPGARESGGTRGASFEARVPLAPQDEEG